MLEEWKGGQRGWSAVRQRVEKRRREKMEKEAGITPGLAG